MDFEFFITLPNQYLHHKEGLVCKQKIVYITNGMYFERIS